MLPIEAKWPPTTTENNIMYEISLNGQVRTVSSQDEVWAAADAMVREAGGGVPSIVDLTAKAAAPVEKARPQGWDVKPEHVDATAKARVEADMAAARGAGFELKEPLFEAGTRLNDMGVDNARKARIEFEQKPVVAEAMSDLQQRIAAEQRRDIEVPTTAIRMDATGRAVLPTGERYVLNRDAFRALVSRAGLPGGAANYLAACWPDLRAKNFNNWNAMFAAEERQQEQAALAAQKKFERGVLNLRTRLSEAGDRYAYAVVSDSYAVYDIDKVAEAIRLAMPDNARAEVHYNGRSAEIIVHFHSTVEPEDYAAGEVFRAGLKFRTDDTGGGSLSGFGFVEQNLCLNLIITNVAAQPVFSLNHLGSVERMAQQFRAGMRKAQDTIAPFMQQWGYARKDDLVAATEGERNGYEGIGLPEILTALLNGAMERDLIAVPGRRDVVIPKIVRAWEADKGTDGPNSGTITRAGFVNALTRYAHEGTESSWQSHGIEQSASTLLWPAHKGGTLPAIPFLPM